MSNKKTAADRLAAMKAHAEKRCNMTMEDIYKEGHGVFSEDYWEMCRPTYIENWPKALSRLSFRQKRIKLSMKQARALGSNIMELGESFGEIQPIAGIITMLDKAIASFPGGAFVRLGSRSPKDSYVGHKNGFRVKSGEQAVKVLTGVSERMYEDLHIAISKNYEPSIFVREFCLEIKYNPEAEFRCFALNGKLLGISQYLYSEVYDGLGDMADEYISKIKAFFEKKFKPASNLDSVVFDVFVGDKKVVLVEINPLFSLTDPCLFVGGKLDGTFRYNKKGVEKVTLS